MTLWLLNVDFIKTERQSGNTLSDLELIHSLNGLIFNHSFAISCLTKDTEKYVNESSLIANLVELIYTRNLFLQKTCRVAEPIRL